MAVYRWKYGARSPVSAQVAGEVCAELEDAGNLTPQALVDASRPEDAPLHAAFEWDDAIAAERYRETQAGYIIRSIEVTSEEIKEPTRAFVSITARRATPYASIEHVMARSDSRAILLDQARMELEAFKRKYQQLTELAGVFAAIDAMEVDAA